MCVYLNFVLRFVCSFPAVGVQEAVAEIAAIEKRIINQQAKMESLVSIFEM